MSHSVSEEDRADWHRRFGSTANNIAWDLLEEADPDLAELLDCAHAAAWHWKQVGTDLQKMRALMLLAAAHARAGLGAIAFAEAEAVRTYFLEVADAPDWELAFTHLIHAHAAWADGRAKTHADSWRHAAEAIEVIADEEDRGIVQRVWRHVPRPDSVS